MKSKIDPKNYFYNYVLGLIFAIMFSLTIAYWCLIKYPSTPFLALGVEQTIYWGFAFILFNDYLKKMELIMNG